MAKGAGPNHDRIATQPNLRLVLAVTDILTIIDAALARKGLSAAAASRMAVGNPSLIKNMRLQTGNSKRFNAEALRKLAEVLDLEFYFGDSREESTVRLPAGFAERTVEPLGQARARREALEMGFLPIPYHPAAAPDFRGTAPVALARQWLRTSGLEAASLAFLPVRSDDMGPTMTTGALALVDTDATLPDGTGIWAISIKGRYVFARVEQPDESLMVLKCDMPDQPVQIIKGDDLRALTVLGKVVWVAQQP